AAVTRHAKLHRARKRDVFEDLALECRGGRKGRIHRASLTRGARRQGARVLAYDPRMAHSRPLTGTCIAITRPAGTGAAWAHRVRALGGMPLLLPGSSLRAAADARAARAALREALACDAVIFTSPAAVAFARRLGAPRSRAVVLAPGVGTQAALRRAGFCNALAPTREDSEGLLTLPILHNVRGWRIGMVGAAGGRGLLDRELVARGARVIHARTLCRIGSVRRPSLS